RRLRGRGRADRPRRPRQDRRGRLGRQHRPAPVRVARRRRSAMNRYPAPLPARISRLDDLAVDLWWSWHAEARIVFRRLDYQLWRKTAHNPVRMLALLPAGRLEAAAADPEFLTLYDSAIASLDAARAARDTWWSARMPNVAGQ